MLPLLKSTNETVCLAAVILQASIFSLGYQSSDGSHWLLNLRECKKSLQVTFSFCLIIEPLSRVWNAVLVSPRRWAPRTRSRLLSQWLSDGFRANYKPRACSGVPQGHVAGFALVTLRLRGRLLNRQAADFGLFWSCFGLVWFLLCSVLFCFGLF